MGIFGADVEWKKLNNFNLTRYGKVIFFVQLPLGLFYSVVSVIYVPLCAVNLNYVFCQNDL